MGLRAVVVATVLCCSNAAWALQQPNGAQVPSDLGCHGGSPVGLAATFACVCEDPGCNIGAPCPGNQDPGSCDDGQHGVCETTLWHDWNGDACIPANVSGLDPWQDAAVVPETFRPTCPLTFTVLTRGTALFRNAFGWYNVTGQQPTADDLHVMLDCDAQPGTAVVLDVLSDPAYRGGDIGFFLITPEAHGASGQCAGGNCCASLARATAGQGYIYYSERGYNPDAAGADSFIHLLIYDSRITPRKFYFAWEDTFGGSNNDFTDLVTSVEGVECAGGGEPCDTGAAGVCGYGVTVCRGAALDCVPLYEPEPEVCDGIDNDCDGIVDEGAMCPDGEICQGGQCVPGCEAGSEFDCPTPLVCDFDTKRCVDPACEGVSCAAEQICRDGECVTACDGIICPVGTSCRQGECVDLCRHVQCADGEVCREGLCFAGCGQCNGVVCSTGLSCKVDSGECVDPSCPDGCPAGTYCDDGDCRDACEGAVCPPGQVCREGVCGTGDGDWGGGGNGDGDGGAAAASCACLVGAPSPPPLGAAALLALAALMVLRRRRGGGRAGSARPG
jgi:hypothetical protein